MIWKFNHQLNGACWKMSGGFQKCLDLITMSSLVFLFLSLYSRTSASSPWIPGSSTRSPRNKYVHASRGCPPTRRNCPTGPCPCWAPRAAQRKSPRGGEQAGHRDPPLVWVSSAGTWRGWSTPWSRVVLPPPSGSSLSPLSQPWWSDWTFWLYVCLLFACN